MAWAPGQIDFAIKEALYGLAARFYGVGHSCCLHSHHAEAAAGLLESIRRVCGLRMCRSYIVCSMARIAILNLIKGYI